MCVCPTDVYRAAQGVTQAAHGACNNRARACISRTATAAAIWQAWHDTSARAQNFRTGAHKPAQVCYNRDNRKNHAGGNAARICGHYCMEIIRGSMPCWAARVVWVICGCVQNCAFSFLVCAFLLDVTIHGGMVGIGGGEKGGLHCYPDFDANRTLLAI